MHWRKRKVARNCRENDTESVSRLRGPSAHPSPARTVWLARVQAQITIFVPWEVSGWSLELSVCVKFDREISQRWEPQNRIFKTCLKNSSQTCGQVLTLGIRSLEPTVFSSKSSYREIGRKADERNYNYKNHLGISSAACPLQRRYTLGFEYRHGDFLRQRDQSWQCSKKGELTSRAPLVNNFWKIVNFHRNIRM